MDNGTRNVQLGTRSTTRTATLFNTLSIDTLFVIVKQMTSPVRMMRSTAMLPYLEAGKSTPDMPSARERVRFLALLFSANSPLRAAAASIVSEINVHWRIPETAIDSSSELLNIGPELFDGEAKQMELGRIIFSACGPYVRRISMSNVPKAESKSKDFVVQFTSHVFHYCRKVEEVRFWGYGAPLTRWRTASAFFREYAANLRVIDWRGEEDKNGFRDLRECVNAKRLQFRNLNNAALVPLLEACGATLEELDISITPVRNSMEVLNAIQNYCKQLSVLKIVNLRNVMDLFGQERYSWLLRSYGSQLRNAKTDGLGHEHLIKVVNACTNLGVIVYWVSKRSADWRHLYDLGPRVARLFLNAGLLAGDEYPGALKHCSNLRELYLSGGYGYGIPELTDVMIANAFSPSRFPKLEHLSVGYFKANERNMALIASCTANLKSASFQPFESGSKVSAFQSIVDANRHLRQIIIDTCVLREADRSSESALESLSELVRIFCKCRTLRLTRSCSDEEEVEKEDLIDICKVLPCRGVDVYVQIGDVKYHYPK